MTDARLRGEWLTAAAHDGLSDPAYRILHNALMHCAEQGTDGAIATRELRFLYPDPIAREYLDELEHAGFWEATPTGYQLIGWSTTLGQSTAADVESVRAANRQRKQRQRAREAAKEDQNSTDSTNAPTEDTHSGTAHSSRRDSARTSRRDVTAGVGRTGRIGPPEGASPSGGNARARAKTTTPTCQSAGHLMDPTGITCLRPGCEYRDADRQEALALEELALAGGVLP